jgi:transcriptional regulator with XRE-family HTH domain
MDNTFIDDFAERLIYLRQRKGLTARDMSLSLGQSHNYINSIESKKSFPSMQMFFYICEILGITPQQFFDYSNATPEFDNKLLIEIKKMDEDLQIKFLELFQEINS